MGRAFHWRPLYRMFPGVYTTSMGLIGLIISVGIMVLGVGYYFFSMPPRALVIENDATAPVAGLSLYEDLKTRANDIKETKEARVAQEIAGLEAGLVAEAPKNNAEDVVAGLASPKDETDEPKATKKAESIDRLMTSGFAVPSKPRTLDTIVLHSSYNPNGGDVYSVSALVKIYESYGVSAHYLIDREGKIYRLVKDEHIAYHAGVSKMPDGRKDVNDFSIGIEMMNKETTQFTSAQYGAVNALVAQLKSQYSIKNIVGHGDIAPGRKTDPWNFDWKKLK